MNIRSSMYRMVSSLIAIPFLLFSLITTYIYNGKLETVIADSLQAVANVQIAEMTRFCRQQMNDLTIIGDMDVTRAALQGELDQGTLLYLDNMLYSYVEATSSLKNYALVDTNNRVVACSADNYQAFARDGMDSLIESMDGEAFRISNVINIKDDHGEECKSVVAIARIEHQGRLLGYALAELNLDFYDNIRRQAELWDKSTFYLLDGNRQIISAGQRENYHESYDSIDFAANPKGSFTFSSGGKDYLTYYSDVQYTNWQFLLTVNMDNYLAGQTVYFILAGILVILCAAIGVWIRAFSSKRIIRPVKRISHTLRDIQKEQDYSLRIGVERNDELGNLSVEINELLVFIETENLYKAKQHRLLQQKAELDSLTKALNKERIGTYLLNAVERHRADGSEMAVLFVDVDDFKAFNTNHGHEVGDQVLLFVVSLLAGETRGTVGRNGGDEFLVVVEAPEALRELDAHLNRIKELFRTRFVIRGTGRSLPVYCCIGAVRVDFGICGKDVTAECLVKMADEAMYEAKRNGKCGHVIWDYDDIFKWDA